MARFLALSLVTLFMCSNALANPGFLVVEGRLTDSLGINPIGSASTTFTLEVFHGNGTCLLYSESHTLDMSGSNGYFGLNLGEGSPLYSGNSGLAPVFNNSVNLNCDGSGPVSPVPNARRLLVITYDLGNGSGPQTLQQDIEIGASGFAMDAQRVGGKSSSELLQVNMATAVLNQTNLNWIFDSARYTELQALINGTSTQYNSGAPVVDVDTNNQRIINVATPTGANDATNKTYVDTNIGGNMASIGVLGGADNGKVLTWDGSANQFVASIPTAVDNSKLPLAGGTMTGAIDMGTQDISNATNIAANGSLRVHNGGNYVGFSAGAAPTNVTWALPDADGTTGQVLSTDGSGNLAWVAAGGGAVASVFGRTGAVISAASDYDANQIDNTAAGDIAATDVQSAINELDSEKLSNAGDNMTGALTMDTQNELRFADTAGGEYVGFRAPNTVSASFVWDLPASDGTSGQVLSTNGSGALSWVSPGGGAGDVLNGGNSGAVVLGSNDNTLELEAGGSTALTINTSGNVGVGLATPGFPLQVNGMISTINGGGIRMEGSTSGFVGFQPAPAAGSTLYTLPSSDGTVGQVLTTDGSGSLSWSASGGGDDLGNHTATLALDMDGFPINNAYEIANIDAGSSSSPSIRFADMGTGIFSPFGSDTIAIATSSMERFRIDAIGNVGIGTSAPGGRLDVGGDIRMLGSTSGYAGFQAPATAGNNVWTLPNADGVADEVLHTDGSGTLYWAPKTVGPVFTPDGSTPMTGNFNLGNNRIMNLASGTALLPAVSFNLDDDTGLFRPGANMLAFTTGASERIRIDTVGNVGIGTNTPARPLHVSGQMRLEPTPIGGGAAGDIAIDSGSGNKLMVHNGSSWRSVVSADGSGIANVGGLSAQPASDLVTSSQQSVVIHANTDGTGVNEGIRFEMGDPIDIVGSFKGADGKLEVGYSTNPNPPGRLTIRRMGGDTDMIHVSHSGGLESPIMNLHRDGYLDIFSYGNTGRLTGHNANGSAASPTQTFNGQVLFALAGKAHDGSNPLPQSSAEIRFVAQADGATSNAGAIRFMTSDGGPLTNRMVIDEQGNVGFGTTTPQVALDASSASDGIALPAGVEGDRPGVDGVIRYNLDSSKVEVREAGGWKNVIGYNPEPAEVIGGTNFDMQSRQVASTTGNCAPMVFNNMKDGGVYKFWVQATAGTCSFQFWSGNGSGDLGPGIFAVGHNALGGSPRLYEFTVVAGQVLVTWDDI